MNYVNGCHGISWSWTMEKQNSLWLDQNNRDQKSTSHRSEWATLWSFLQTVSRTSASSLMRTFPWINTSRVSRAVCISTRNIGLVRKHINQPVAELLTHALITSRLDTCNSLLHSLNKTQLKRLKRLQNTAARLVTLSRKCTDITPILKHLHWLPIEQRIIFKISMFVLKTIHSVSSTYLCSPIHWPC